ncbi:cysteine desulfurase family protein [Telmatospirillum sp.]|uniref:cysteine desulfurase family protein n=1 Tax=Telmatospirillum sp. TaxID=2079197 RepID=UPI002843057E|nr:cysteine desulfurase family protein [Telmatospirillum sp.]MDR3439009.1 cysteine desulfurase family protein [Telmatospirillum sp.]
MAAAAVYLDYNATAPVRPAARGAMLRAMAHPGNPSSIHGFGRAARRLVEDAREAVACLVGASPEAVVFTSGGTEANALALAGWGRRRLLWSAIEHPSVLKAAPGESIPVGPDGRVDLSALEELLAASREPAVVAVMAANNETGVLQPVADVVRIAKAHGAVVHCDAVQAVGRVDIDMAALGIDSLALSAHKLGGPTGVGALVLANSDVDLAPLLRGGGQERNRRAGTENLPGIAGLGAAARAVQDDVGEMERLAILRDRLEQGARQRVPSLVVFGGQSPRVSNTACLAMPGVTAQTLLMGLDLAGVAVSAGSACSSGKLAPSHVLIAMGAGPLAASAIRVSLGWASRDDDVERFLDAFGAVTGRLAAGRGTAERHPALAG